MKTNPRWMPKLTALRTFFVFYQRLRKVMLTLAFCQSSSVVGKEFDKACRGEVRAFPSTTAHKKSGGDGGFTCCVPGCFNNNKKNPELSFYNFPNGKGPESQELRKKWIHLISRKGLLTTFSRRQKNIHELFTDLSTENN